MRPAMFELNKNKTIKISIIEKSAMTCNKDTVDTN